MNLEQIIKSNQGTIIDVRSQAEFMGGHVAGSINIPLPELEKRVSEIQTLPKPLVLCCASGNRSGQAEFILKNNNILDCINGGSWFNVNFYQSQAVCPS